MEWIRTLLSSPLTTRPAELIPWWQSVAPALQGRPTLEQSLIGGFAADRLGLAFVAGYQAALTRLVGERGPDELLAVSFTEEGGAHPRSIRSTLVPQDPGWLLSGTKVWTTCGPIATGLLVVASTGERDGRNLLRAVRVPTDAEGVEVQPMPEAPFVPEVPHGVVVFTDVAVAELLPGDGYTAWLKPFRTIEDLHIHAALIGHLLRIGRQADWPPEVLEGLLVPALALEPLVDQDPLDPSVHRALGGVLAHTRQLLDDLGPHWGAVDPVVRERWERDRVLLKVAGRARTLRLERARALDRGR